MFKLFDELLLLLFMFISIFILIDELPLLLDVLQLVFVIPKIPTMLLQRVSKESP